MRISSTPIVFPLALAVACGGGSSSGPDSGNGGTDGANGGSVSAGNPGIAGATSTAGGAASGGAASGGATGVAGSGAPSAGASNTAGATNAGAGGASGGAPGSAGATTTGGSGAAAGTGGVSGSASGGAAGAPAGGTGGSGKACTRELLKGTVDAYFEALAAHDASTLPLASTVKFTENGKTLELGKDGLWKSAGMVKYHHDALDTEICTAASQGVVPDGNTDIPFALRIKLQAGEITEIETIAPRQGDYAAVASNPAAIIASADTVKWEEPVPMNQRNTRQEITAWIDKYFRVFPNGVCNTTSSCRRLENGGGNFSCSGGASCRAGQPGPGDANLNPRLLLADVETGIGVGLTVYQSHTDMHMYKMYGGQIYAVHAILARGSSGWD